MMKEEEEQGGMPINHQGHVDDNNNLAGLPPGFRFHPTDEEIVTCYLTEKMLDGSFTAAAIGEADLNKSEPWDLPNQAKMGEKEWYFFCQRDRKYPTGMRTNRATESGYWKATGKDKEIFRKGTSKNKALLVGMKKTLVFYTGRAPKGEKTNWVMHEYRLHGRNFSNSSKDEWVVCRVFHKNMGMMKKTSSLSPTDQGGHLLRLTSFGDDFLETSSSSLPPLMDPTPSYQENHSTSYPNNNRFNYRDHNDQATTTTKATIPTSPLSSPTDLPYYFQVGSNSTSFQLPNAYGYPQMTPNPSFSFHQDQYLRQNLMTSTPSNYIQDSSFNLFQSTPIDHQAILRGAKHNNETSLTTLGSSTQCKVEQYSSSMFSVSQETGLSTADMNVTEITSKPEIDVGSSSINTLYEDHRSPYDVPFSEIEGLWDY